MSRNSPNPGFVVGLLAILMGACVVDPSSDKACTMLGCQNGFVVAFQASSWPTGSYQVALEADGRTVLCSATIPLAKGTPANACDADDVQLGLSGSELAVAQQSLSEVRFLGTLPKQVRVIVRRDSSELAEQTYSPTYKTSQPNGPACEPTCTNASDVLSW
ncbi:MAG: hypothetical protein HY898_26785 [Deltaproteobacteria bacterium]|nr:hypothetical protein [Deltaproteobacteria bacterium]